MLFVQHPDSTRKKQSKQSQCAKPYQLCHRLQRNSQRPKTRHNRQGNIRFIRSQMKLQKDIVRKDIRKNLEGNHSHQSYHTYKGASFRSAKRSHTSSDPKLTLVILQPRLTFLKLSSKRSLNMIEQEGVINS